MLRVEYSSPISSSIEEVDRSPRVIAAGWLRAVNTTNITDKSVEPNPQAESKVKVIRFDGSAVELSAEEFALLYAREES